MGKKQFVAIELNPEYETYIVHVRSVNFAALPSSSLLNVYLSRKLQIASLLAKKAPTKIPAEYSDFADVFSADLASKLSKQTRINKYAIKLFNSQQSPYGLTYSLRLVKLETLKAYIKTNLTNRFIRPSKSPISAPILFDQKSNGFLYLCVNYQSFNNLTIKNRYPLPLIGELLDRLRRTRRFTQLELTNIYYQMRICKGDE